ncbi:MAG TPA: DUF1707 domain-containing protein [Actinospica sp.]|nr:DUF1707 domain-containing protein [Actinospica sp.]
MERYSAEPDRARVRASDAERDEALTALAAHYADGRLDQPEFNRRADAALAAVTREQLRGLFTDLPAAERRRQSQAVRRRPARALPIPPALLAVLLAFAVIAVLHGLPPFPLFALLFILSRRRRRWHRETRPWT